MAALENGLGAVAASSGQSAQFMAIATIVCAFHIEPGYIIDRARR